MARMPAPCSPGLRGGKPMRSIALKYAGECRACSTPLAVGTEAVYEKRVGVFCPPCAPTDSEAIRAIRQDAADQRADRYDEWAAKREAVAGATLQTISDRYRGDHAFNTQPGYIPERARVIRREGRALGNLGGGGRGATTHTAHQRPLPGGSPLKHPPCIYPGGGQSHST